MMQPGEIYMADFGPAVLHKLNGRVWAARGVLRREVAGERNEHIQILDLAK